MPAGSHLVGNADDVAAIIMVQNVENAKKQVNQVIIRKKSWFEDKVLKLATEKTALIFLSRKWIPFEIDITMCDTTLTTRKVVNYLGIQLAFWAQKYRHAAIKAAKVTSLHSGLMANIDGPIQSRRRLITAMMNSILLYGSEAWADNTSVDCRMKILSSVQWTSGVRVVSAYRTVSKTAILVISGEMPIGLQASEQKRLWTTRSIYRETANVNETSGKLTAKLLPDITRWMERKFGEVDYYLTELLSGHGYL